MTVLQQPTRNRVVGRKVGRYAAVAVLATAVGVGAGLGISGLDNERGVAFEGPAVERSLAMNENLDALINGAYAQQANGLGADPSSGAIYEGPAVERSLAMNQNLDALIRGAYAQQAGAIRSD